jgi:hypothetical protein
VPLILYRREGCDLCDLAERALINAGAVDWTAVEVGWAGELAERYGWVLPVIREADSGRELAWPFDAWQVREFMSPPDTD